MDSANKNADSRFSHLSSHALCRPSFLAAPRRFTELPLLQPVPGISVIAHTPQDDVFICIFRPDATVLKAQEATFLVKKKITLNIVNSILHLYICFWQSLEYVCIKEKV